MHVRDAGGCNQHRRQRCPTSVHQKDRVGPAACAHVCVFREHKHALCTCGGRVHQLHRAADCAHKQRPVRTRSVHTRTLCTQAPHTHHAHTITMRAQIAAVCTHTPVMHTHHEHTLCITPKPHTSIQMPCVHTPRAHRRAHINCMHEPGTC